MEPQTSDMSQPVDKWIAIVGAAIPAAIVMGVVVFEFFISLAGLIWLISRIKYPISSHRHITGDILFWPMVSWLLIVIISRVVNGGSAHQIAHDFCFLRYPLFAVAMIDLSSRFPIHRYLIGGIFVGIVYAALNLASAHLIGFDFTGKPIHRYVSKLNEGAKIGGLCAYSAPMLLLWAVFDQKLDKHKRWLVALTGIMGALLLVNSMVRTAILAALAGGLGGFLSQMVVRKKVRISSTLLFVLLAGFGMWAAVKVQPSLTSMYDRVYYWNVSWQLWLQNPIFGVGISSFKEAYLQVAESGIVPPFVAPNGIAYQELTPHHAHNLFLQLLASSGLLGLSVFGWMFIRIIKALRRFTISWQPGLQSWPFICLTIGLTGWNIYDPFYTTLVFYFMTMISVSERLAEEPETTLSHRTV